MRATPPPSTRRVFRTEHVFRPDAQMLARQMGLVLLLCAVMVLPVFLGFGIRGLDALSATATVFAVALGISGMLYLVLVPVHVEITPETLTVRRRLGPPRVLARREIRHVSYDTRQDAIRLFVSAPTRWTDRLMADLVIRTGSFSTPDTEAMLSLLTPAPDRRP